MRSPADPEQARLWTAAAERLALGAGPEAVARALKLDVPRVRARRRALKAEPLGPVAARLIEKVRHLAWQAGVRYQLEGLSPKAGEVPRLRRITPKAFLERYYARHLPVVLTGMMRGWRALGRWSPQHLKERFGDAQVSVTQARRRTRFYDAQVHAISRPMRLGQFVDWVDAHPTSNDRYLVANNDALARPELQPLLADIGFFSGLLDPARTAGFVYLWFGPGGTVTPLHHDTTNILFCQVWGGKRVTLISPLHAPLLDTSSAYYSTLDLERPRTRRALAAQGARLLEVDLAPGEALFIPAGWWHHVRSKSVSISVSMTNFVFPNSYDPP
jgi:hypothetical protein